MEVRAAYAFALALSLSMLLIPPLARAAGSLGLIDRGGGRKVHVGVVPRIGGIAIFSGFLLPVLIWVPLRPDIRAFVIASAVLFVFSVLDDRFNLNYRLKLLSQGLAALIVALYGGVLIERMPFLFEGNLPYFLALPFTIFVLVGVTNAVNLSDGLDGLAGGISLLALGCLLLLAYQAEDSPLYIVMLAVMGATFGFLRYNTFPARIFMGDAGSQFLGFSSGVLAVIITQHSDRALSPVIPILILGLPILDTLSVIVGRISSGRSPFKADRTHLHHRLLASGLNQYEAVSLVYGAQFVMVVLAYLLRYSSDSAILLTYAAFCVLALLGVRGLERHHRHLKRRDADQNRFLRLISAASKARFFTRAPFVFLSAAIPVFLVVGSFVTPPVDRDIAVVSGALFVTLLLMALVRRLPFPWVERLTAYYTAATVAFLVESARGLMETCGLCIHLLYCFIALGTAIWVRFSSDQFKVNSLDLLVLLAAIVAPTMRGLGLQNIGLVALESIILFYAIEVVVQERERDWDPLRVGVLGALAVLTVRGFLP